MRIWLAPPCLLLAACGGGAAAGTLATRTDSAGITIVTNTDASWREGEGWRIGETPLVQIGHREDDDPRYDLVRVSGGSLLHGREVAVVASGSREIRLYSASGEWQRTIGRQGDGPGEFRSPQGPAARSGDTLFIPDGQLGRLTAVSTSGAYLTAWPYLSVEGAGRIFPSHRLADGSWVSYGSVPRSPREIPAEGLSRRALQYFRLASDLSAILDTLGQPPGSEQFLHVERVGGVIRMVRPMLPPLGRSSPATAAGDRFIWGDNAFPELRIYAPDGRLTSLLRWDAPAIPVDAALIDRLRQAAIARADGRPQSIETAEIQFAIPSPASVVPYFSSVRVDADGAIWVQEYLILQTDPVTFRIFHPDGQYLGRLALPPRHRVLDIGVDRILTVWQDDDDLEYLRVYRLHR